MTQLKKETIVKNFSKFINESQVLREQEDITQLLNIGLISIKDYFKILVDLKIDLIDFFLQNFGFFSYEIQSKKHDDYIKYNLIYRDTKYYLGTLRELTAPQISKVDSHNLAKIIAKENNVNFILYRISSNVNLYHLTSDTIHENFLDFMYKYITSKGWYFTLDPWPDFIYKELKHIKDSRKV